MKNISYIPFVTLLITTSLFCSLSLQADEGQVTRGHSSRSKEKSCSDCDFVIDAKDINCRGVDLTKPGYYCLCEDVVFNPQPNQNTPYQAAIRISASNVTLDLRGRTLSQKSKDVFNVDGVIVDPGLTNIIIKNGTIRDFSDAGIRAGTVTPTPGPVITELSISDIRSFNNGNGTTVFNPRLSTGDAIGGAVILNAQDVKITNCDFNENFFTGMWALNITKLTAENSHFDDNVAGNLAFQNLLITYGAAVTGPSVDIAFRSCTFNNNSSGGLVAGFNSGFAAAGGSTTNILFDSCQFNRNSATVDNTDVAIVLDTINGGTKALGIEMNNGTNVVFNNCEASGTSLTLNVPISQTFPPANNITTETQGFDLEFCSNAMLTNCQSSGNVFQNNGGIGVRQFTQSFNLFASNQVTLSNCHADGNTNGYNAESAPTEENPSLLIVEGFDTSSSGNIVFEDCTASNHHQAAADLVALDGAFSITAGFNSHFFLLSSSKCRHCGPVVFRRCVALGNTDTGTAGGRAFGFSTREPQFAGTQTGPNSGPFVFESCIAENNTNNIIDGSPVDTRTGSGFDIFNLVNSKIIDCFAEGNNIGINVTDFNNEPGFTFGSADNIISNNVVSANTTFGIQDLTAAKSNAYYSNRAKNNGPTPITTNYSGAGVFPIPSCSTPCCCTPANLTPVLYWMLPNAPCTINTNCITPGVLDNLSIIN
jgi:hypothetical protein